MQSFLPFGLAKSVLSDNDLNGTMLVRRIKNIFGLLPPALILVIFYIHSIVSQMDRLEFFLKSTQFSKGNIRTGMLAQIQRLGLSLQLVSLDLSQITRETKKSRQRS